MSLVSESGLDGAELGLDVAGSSLDGAGSGLMKVGSALIGEILGWTGMNLVRSTLNHYLH